MLRIESVLHPKSPKFQPTTHTGPYDTPSFLLIGEVLFYKFVDYVDLIEEEDGCDYGGCYITYREGHPDSVKTIPRGEDKQQRNHAYYLSRQGKEYRFPCHSQRLEEVGGNYLEPNYPETEGGVMQTIYRTGYLFAILHE